MRTAWLLAAVGVLVAGGEAWSQSTGTFGNRNVGSSFTPNNSSAFNRGAGVGAGTGVGGFGSISGMGGSGVGMRTVLAGATQQVDTTVGQVSGNERFLRSNRAGQFVGADSGDVATGLFNALGRGLAGGIQQRGYDGNANAGGQQSSASKVRRTMVVGFDYAPPVAAETAPRVEQMIARTSRLQTRGPVQIDVVEGTAILRGVVATDHDRALIEQLIALEAGIWAVRNELTVAPPAPESPPEASTLPEASAPGPAIPMPAPAAAPPGEMEL